ncbi:MAG: hemolysin III family protein [Xanthomonadales bacterium]|nr:hemolysin III family protein [Xanthomonadales bacterium]
MIKTYPPLEEKINIYSHVFGLILSLVGLVALMYRAAQNGSGVELFAVGIFGLSMVCLYAVSALYHSATEPSIRIRRRVFDHACIYALIAGTYTPFALIALPPTVGKILFIASWGVAVTGIVLKLFYTGRFDRLSTLMYVAMGWMVLLFVRDFIAVLSTQAMMWLAAGGIIYTLGAVMYSIERIPMGHAIFHVCVVLGSLCHFICIYFYVL